MGVFVLVVRCMVRTAEGALVLNPHLVRELNHWADLLAGLGGACVSVLVVATHFDLLGDSVAATVSLLDAAAARLQRTHADTLRLVGPSAQRLWFALRYSAERDRASASETDLRAAIVRVASDMARSMVVPSAYLEAQRCVDQLWGAQRRAEHRRAGGVDGGSGPRSLASLDLLRRQLGRTNVQLRHAEVCERAFDYLNFTGTVLRDARLRDAVVLEPLQWLGSVLAQLARDSPDTRNQLLAVLRAESGPQVRAALLL